MSKKLMIKKDNALINAAYTLTLAEQRLILLSVALASEDADKLRSTSIHAHEYAKRFNVSHRTAYQSLHDAKEQLFDRYFTYQQTTKSGAVKQVKSRWVQKVAYIKDEGTIEIMFADDVLPLLCELKNRFTAYNLEAIAELTSVHAIRLYELVIAWRSQGKTPVISTEDLRQKLGILPDEYKLMHNFKRRVLDNAIKQINDGSDIKVSYEQHKSGRAITGFSFTFAPKTQSSGVTNNEEPKKKRQKITKQEAEKMAWVGEEWPALLARLSKDYIVTGLTKKN